MSQTCIEDTATHPPPTLWLPIPAIRPRSVHAHTFCKLFIFHTSPAPAEDFATFQGTRSAHSFAGVAVDRSAEPAAESKMQQQKQPPVLKTGSRRVSFLRRDRAALRRQEKLYRPPPKKLKPSALGVQATRVHPVPEAGALRAPPTQQQRQQHGLVLPPVPNQAPQSSHQAPPPFSAPQPWAVYRPPPSAPQALPVPYNQTAAHPPPVTFQSPLQPPQQPPMQQQQVPPPAAYGLPAGVYTQPGVYTQAGAYIPQPLLILQPPQQQVANHQPPQQVPFPASHGLSACAYRPSIPSLHSQQQGMAAHPIALVPPPGLFYIQG